MASGKSKEELEAICVKLALKNRVAKEKLKDLSKLLNKLIKEL